MHFGLDDYNTYYLWLNAENDEYDALEREMAIHLNVSSSSIDRKLLWIWMKSTNSMNGSGIELNVNSIYNVHCKQAN